MRGSEEESETARWRGSGMGDEERERRNKKVMEGVRGRGIRREGGREGGRE